LLSRLRRHRLWQRLRYEVIYSWPRWRECSAFNIGYRPLDAAIAGDPACAAEPNQIQLYAELVKTARLAPDSLRRSKVLEIAAGRGGGLAWLARAFAPAQLAGIDISRSAVRHARERGLDVRRAAADRVPFPDRSFDLVLSLEALVHLADREAVAREVARVLKPSGLYVVGDFIREPISGARHAIDRLAAAGRFQVREFRDATAGAVASLEQDHDRKTALVESLPGFIRAGLAEAMWLKGSQRYDEWQRGARSYFIAVLTPQLETAG